MPVSESQKRATAKYEKENYDKVLVRFPKGTKNRIKDTGGNDSIQGPKNRGFVTGYMEKN